MYDISYEELLTELIADTYITYSGARLADEEKARTAAKALMPYFVGIEYPDSEICRWDWIYFLFRWEEGGEVYAGHPYGANTPEELKAQLPEAMWASLNGTWVETEVRDTNFVRKHLRMYEGYPFP